MNKNGMVWKLIVILIIITFNCSDSVLAASTYDSTVLSDNPTGYWMLTKGDVKDASGHGLTGTYYGKDVENAVMPNGDSANIFNGTDNYFEIPDNDYLEVTKTGILTVEAWIRPDVIEFPVSESSGYVHWMGKGTAGNQSWVARIYNYTNKENRPNRISGYSFNLAGGLGAGSYFQDVMSTGKWLHYALTINTVNTSEKYPTGYTKLFKNGVLRDQDRLSDYKIIPGNGNAPMRIATRDLNSFFKGAIGKVAVYDYELTPERLTAHYTAMGSPKPYGVSINGLNIELDNPEYTLENGVTMIPIRQVAERYGYKVAWDEERQTVELSKEDKLITLMIGDYKFNISGKSVKLAAVPELKYDKTYVPLEFIGNTILK